MCGVSLPGDKDVSSLAYVQPALEVALAGAPREARDRINASSVSPPWHCCSSNVRRERSCLYT